VLPLQSLIQPPRQAGDLPGTTFAGPPAALTRARLISSGGGRAVFAGPGSDGEPLTVQAAAVADGVIRVSLSRDGAGRPRAEAALALVRDLPPYSGGAAAERDAAEVRLQAGALVAVVTPDPWALRFEDAAGRTLLALQSGDTDVTGAPCSVPFGCTRLGDGTCTFHISFAARPDEQFYGLGERFGPLGKRGTRTVAWIEDALGVSGRKVYKAVPAFWSTRGYALVVNSGAPTEIDLGHTSHSTVSVLTPDDTLEFFVIAAAGPEDAIGPLRALTGDVPLPPRWAWFGALSPLNRYHGNTSRLPWDQAPEVYASTRDIAAARYRLLPYLYSSAIDAVRDGRTLLRPMIAACPGDRATRDADGQYLLGTDLLVAPVTAADGEQDVYLPAGDWIDYATRAVYPGSRWLRLTRPPEQAPLFVRSGALLPVDPGPAASAAADPEFIGLEVWGAAGGQVTVHEQRGTTQITLATSGGTAALTTDGPAPLARVEWPMLPAPGAPDWPRRLTVNARPWVLDRSSPARLSATPA